jgi:probable rRNA maturation factor
VTDSFLIDVADRQTTLKLDPSQIVKAVEMILNDATVTKTEISVAVVDDPTIHQLNRQYLDHDYPTDVLSFVLEQEENLLEGEVIVSADTAAARAAEFGWSAAEELLLYVIHGTLHLVGYDDRSPHDRAEMRAREHECLKRLGIDPPRQDRDPADPPADGPIGAADEQREEEAT